MIKKIADNKLFKKIFCLEMWNIGRTRNIELAINTGNLINIEWLNVDLKSSFYADPVGVIETKSTSKLVFEKLDLITNRGSIVSIPINNFGEKQLPNVEIDDQNLHFSYPTVLVDSKNQYLIPECSQSQSLRVYQQGESEWSFTTIDSFNGIRVLDPTFFKHNKIWYVFYTLEDDQPNSKLRISTSINFMGPWQEHPHSPILTGLYGARPAGPIFVHQGKIIRPSQDNRHGYGSAILLNEINELSPDSFKEKPLIHVNPPKTPYDKGAHSFLIHNEFLYIDGKRYDYSIRAPFIKLLNVTRQIIKKYSR